MQCVVWFLSQRENTDVRPILACSRQPTGKNINLLIWFHDRLKIAWPFIPEIPSCSSATGHGGPNASAKNRQRAAHPVDGEEIPASVLEKSRLFLMISDDAVSIRCRVSNTYSIICLTKRLYPLLGCHPTWFRRYFFCGGASCTIRLK